ncbi:site-specific integrase [Mucilaginibacter sp.]|nr:site-specific integrase [Mucilaginibacter sp.]
MKATNKFGIHFKIRSERVKEGKAPVFVGIAVDGDKAYMALKNCQAELIHWDTAKGCGKSTTKQGRQINNYLDEIRIIIKNHYKELELSGARITLEAIKNAFLGNVDEDKPITFAQLIAYHNEQGVTLLAAGTMRHYLVTQRYLIKFFQQKFNKPDVNLTILDYKFISDFELFLYNHKPKDHQKPMDTNGVLKHIVRLKKMTNLAVKLKWLPSDPFQGFKMTKKRVDKDFLSEFELKAIEEKKFEVERLSMVRDLFVFACYTGLSYVDMANLENNHIVKGIDGENWIHTNRQKTSIPVNTPILPKAQAIINRYRNNVRAEEKGTVFPVISNQKVNSYLKEIADLCGVRKNLTFHVARHTFATTITLSNGVPIETVSRMLGHNKLSTTQIYARVLEKKVSEDMAELRNKLSHCI